MFWLPLFLSTASYASTQMQIHEIASVASNDAQGVVASEQNAMPEHCTMSSTAKSKAADHKDQTSHGKCQHCGFCVNIAFYPLPVVNDLPTSPHTLSAHIAWASLPHFTATDQRPPIIN